MAPGIIAARVAKLHDALGKHQHPFVERGGLVIYEGSPDVPTTSLLRCIAEYNSIKYTLEVRGCLPLGLAFR